MKDNLAEDPRVSVIMPVYNDEAFVGEALKSVLAQTESNFEIIVCDDASTDDSALIVGQLASTDRRVKTLRNHVNRGVCFTRDRAISVARGQWIALLDGDDCYHPQRLQKMLQFAEMQDADMVADGFLLIDENGKRSGEEFVPCKQAGKKVNVRAYVENGMPSGRRFNFGYLKPMIRRDFVARHALSYHPDAWCGQDFVFYFECLLHDADFRLMKGSYYYYRKYPRPRTVESKIKRTRRHQENNRFRLQRAKTRPDLVILLKKRHRFFNYSVRDENRMTAVKAMNLAGVLQGWKGGREYWGFCLRMLARRLINRVKSRLRAFSPSHRWSDVGTTQDLHARLPF